MSPSRRPPSVSQTVLKLLINKAFTQVNNHINCGSDGFPPKEPSRQLGLGRRQRKQENGVPEKCDVSQHGRQDQTPHDVKAGPRGQGGLRVSVTRYVCTVTDGVSHGNPSPGWGWSIKQHKRQLNRAPRGAPRPGSAMLFSVKISTGCFRLSP